MSLGNLSVAFSIEGKVARSFSSMMQAVKGDFTQIDQKLSSLKKQKVEGKQALGSLAHHAKKGQTSLGKLSGTVQKTGRDMGGATQKTRQFNQELVRLRAMKFADLKIGRIKQQLDQTKTAALGVIATGYTLKRLYSSAANVLKAQGDIATLGISETGIQTITQSAQEMALQFGQITAPQFIKASYDIKSGIASLSEAGVKDFTRMAGTTAVATKSSVEEMTKLYALGYGIFRQDFGSDVDFGKQFSGAIATSVQMFKTDGSDLSQGLANIGSDAKALGVSLAEELAILGVAKEGLNSASEAGTKYRAFLAGAGKAQEKLNLTFTDSQGKMLPMVDILNLIKAKYGESLEVAEKMELDAAFGSGEASGLIASLIGKTDTLTQSQRDLEHAMQGGLSKAEEMAQAADRGQGFEKLGNAFGYIGYTLGKVLEPAVNLLASAIGGLAKGIAWLDRTFPVLVPAIVGVGSALGALFMIVKTVKLAKLGLQLANLTLSKSYLKTAVSSTLAGGSIQRGGIIAKASAGGHYVLKGALTAVQGGVGRMSLAFSLAKLKTLAFATASKFAAAGQWLFNAALSANPIGALIVGVAGLAAGAVWLYKNFEPFTHLVNTVWDAFKGLFSYIAEKWQLVGGLFSGVADFFGMGSNQDKHLSPKAKTLGAEVQSDSMLPASLASASQEGLPPSPPNPLPAHPPHSGRGGGGVAQNIHVQVVVNHPTSNVDIEHAITQAMRQQGKRGGTSLSDEVI